MAVAVEMDFKGATLEQYDEVMRLMGFDSDPTPPPGALFHWVAETSDGIRVVDVWESREAYEKFAAEQIGPFTQQAGVPSPPETTYRELHNHMGA